MKKTIIYLVYAFIFLGAISFASSKQRIGIYDSRSLAVWYFNTQEYKDTMQTYRNQYKTANEKKDSITMKKIGDRMQLTQRILHDKAFGRGSMAIITEKRKDELQALAKSENLIAIVSKWELNYSTADVELVDITIKLLELLKAPDNVKKMDFGGNPPIDDAFFIED